MGGRSLRNWISNRISAFLTRPLGHYERNSRTDVEQLRRQVRKGDVLLVEGDQRVSWLIKSLTHSSWSHAALYVGDELLKRPGPLRDLALEHFGEDAEHMLVEALIDGVVVSPIGKYGVFNVRLCRPHRIRSAHIAEVVDRAIEAIGLQYDMRNIFDLALHLGLASLLPGRRRRVLRMGSLSSRTVICTSLIGRLFQTVGFPVLPEVSRADTSPPSRRLRWFRGRRPKPHAGVYRRRDPTLLTPRDFDLSPYFEVVKFGVVGSRGFDYQRIEWAESAGSPDGEDENLASSVAEANQN